MNINEKVAMLKELINQVVKVIPSAISSILEPIIFVLQTLKDACDKLVEFQENKEKNIWEDKKEDNQDKK